LGKRPLFVRENSLIAGDLMVLAITALEVAVAEKDIANAMDPADRRFLTVMRNNGADIESCIGAAEAEVPAGPINTALPGTDAAVLQGQGRGERRVQGRFLAEAAEGERLFLGVFMELAIACRVFYGSLFPCKSWVGIMHCKSRLQQVKQESVALLPGLRYIPQYMGAGRKKNIRIASRPVPGRCRAPTDTR